MDKEKTCNSQNGCPIVSKVLPALLIAIGITLLGIFIRNGLGGISSNQRVVTVRGLCEREFEANKVTWPIVSKAMGNDLTVLYSQIESTNNAITSFLKSNGIPEASFPSMPRRSTTSRQTDMATRLCHTATSSQQSWW